MSAIIISRGLKAGKPGKPQARQPLRQLVAKGAGEALRNPRVGIACAEAFIARGDLVVVATYLSLWAKEAGSLAGLSLTEAMAKAGMLAVIVSVAQLLFSPVAGFVLDKVDRVTGMSIAMGIAGVAYLWVGFSPDPLALVFIPAALMLGMGESAAILSGAAVIGQEANEDIRGSVMGLFTFCGSVGTLIIAVVCGILFDAWMPGAPFVFVGCINLLILILAVRVRIRTGYRPPGYRASA
jgi:MFS family permease